jgi:hypothetical protein
MTKPERLKAALLDASARYEQGGSGVGEDVEAILIRALIDTKALPPEFTAASKLNELSVAAMASIISRIHRAGEEARAAHDQLEADIDEIIDRTFPGDDEDDDKRK